MSSVIQALTQWNQQNADEITWASTVADQFAKIGAGMLVPDAALGRALAAKGVAAERSDLQVDPPTALGGLPTSGFSDDPVNACTGNFVEPQPDLVFIGGAATLSWGRMYNSMLDAEGAFGRGWASMAESCMVLTDEAARWVMADGRHVLFPRLGEGWDRADGASLWLQRTADDGADVLLVTDNDGGRWAFSLAGEPLWEDRGPGTRVSFEYIDGCLVGLHHEQGRSVRLEWAGDRIVAASADDGRRVTYSYDEAGYLVHADSAGGGHRYDWNEQGLLVRVTDADGVVEVENTYDERARVTSQRSTHGRVSHYAYLANYVTVVSDADGSRANTWMHDAKGRLVGVVDSDGHRQSASWDRWGNQVMVTDRKGAITVREYDRRGRLTAEVGPTGARVDTVYDQLDRVVEVRVTGDGGQVSVTRYGYNGENRNPVTVQDPVGGTTSLTWERGTLLAKVVDPTGVVLSMGYDENGDLVSTTNGDGHTARLERDRIGRVVAAVTPLGHRTEFGYDALGRCISRKDPDGGIWRFEFSPAGRLLATVDPLGGRVEVERDEAGEESATIDELGRRVERQVDDLGNLTRVLLPDGSTWEFTYDAMSRMKSIKDAAGGVAQFRYDPDGVLKATVDPVGAVRRFEVNELGQPLSFSDDDATDQARYDRLGRMVATINPDGSATTTRYDLAGLPVEVIDEAGGVTSIERDLAGRVVAVTQPMGRTFRYEYDACGRWAATVSTGGDRYEIHYDADSRICGETWPTGEEVITEFDECGRAVARREPGRGWTRLGYDKAGRLVWSRDTWYGIRKFGYDAAGQLVWAQNAAGGTTWFAYDQMGRLATMTDPMGEVTSYTYDSMGRLLTSKDPLGRVTRCSYDLSGRMTCRVDPAGGSLSWSYDSTGRLVEEWANEKLLAATSRDFAGRTTTITEGETVHRLEWDVLGNLVSRSRGDEQVRWSYDENSCCTQIVRPNQDAASYTYDSNNRLASFVAPGLGKAIIERDQIGRIVSVHADGLYALWEYADGAVVHQRVERNGLISESFVTRDDNGRVLSDKTDGITTTYSYDPAGQLVGARTSEGLTTIWEYDENGRMVREDAAGKVTTFAYDAASQLVSVTRAGGTTTYTYDGAGQRVREEGPDRERRFTWDPRGFLDSITRVTHEGDRVTTETQRLWVDALGELARVDQDSVWWDSASVMPALVQYGARSVVTEAGVTGLGGPDASWLPPTYAARDHGSNPMDPWAVASNVGVTAQGSLLVQGVEWMSARVYDPTTRGFLSTDPLPGVTGAGWSGNPYSFAGNDPVNFSDPWGLRPLSDRDLQAYRDVNRSPIKAAAEAAGGWLKGNWEYVAGGAMVAAGGVLMATGVGGPVGVALISAGGDTIYQKVAAGGVNWAQVGVSFALGGIGGAELGAVRAASTNGMRAIATSSLVNGAVGGGASTLAYGLGHDGPATVRGYVGSFAGGFVAGGISGVAGPEGGTIAKALTGKAAGRLAVGSTVALSAAGAGGGDLVAQLIADPGQDIDWKSAGKSTLVGAGWTALLGHTVPTSPGTTTLSQYSYFGTRLKSFGPNAKSLIGSAGIGGITTLLPVLK